MRKISIAGRCAGSTLIALGVGLAVGLRRRLAAIIIGSLIAAFGLALLIAPRPILAAFLRPCVVVEESQRSLEAANVPAPFEEA